MANKHRWDTPSFTPASFTFPQRFTRENGHAQQTGVRWLTRELGYTITNAASVSVYLADTRFCRGRTSRPIGTDLMGQTHASGGVRVVERLKIYDPALTPFNGNR